MRTLADGDYIFAVEVANAWERKTAGTYIQSGGAPTWGAGMDTDVAAGNIVYNDAVVAITPASITHDTEAVLTVRYDTITISSVGVVVNTKGTVEATAPQMPANSTLIAIVRILNGVSAITAADIYDARQIVYNHSDEHETGGAQVIDMDNLQHGDSAHTQDYVRTVSEPFQLDGARDLSFDIFRTTTGQTIAAGVTYSEVVTTAYKILPLVRVYDVSAGSGAATTVVITYEATTGGGGNQWQINFTNPHATLSIKIDITLVAMNI